MIKVVQFGEGNFLRSFVDHYFNELNSKGHNYQVDIVKPRPFGLLDKYARQNNKYTVLLRGYLNGAPYESIEKINVISSVISPFNNYDDYIKLAIDPDLKIIVSNTTEAGICFNDKDDFNDLSNMTFPAKLTKFLFERFTNGLSGVYLLPVELIDNNADCLKKCVDLYIDLWNLPSEFKAWNDTSNYYCNTLVDRIVSGYPKTKEDEDYAQSLLNEKDELLSIGEPFGLWAIEKKGDIDKYIVVGFHGIDVVLTNDIAYYKKRKVRVLNGSHTNIVPVGLIRGAITVYDCMVDEFLRSFLEETLENEIIPFVSNDISETKKFANSVVDRFLNPYLNHQLTSIALNSISKWRARNLPSFKDYYSKFGVIPKNLTYGFASLMKIYSGVKFLDGKYYFDLKERRIELNDDISYLNYFANGGDIKSFMSNEGVWGEDLTNYKGFYNKVEEIIGSL